MTDPRTLRDDPKRLRECLRALSEHTAADVLRMELRLGARGQMVLIATSSKGSDSERYVARMVAELLAGMGVRAEKPEPPAEAATTEVKAEDT